MRRGKEGRGSGFRKRRRDERGGVGLGKKEEGRGEKGRRGDWIRK